MSFKQQILSIQNKKFKAYIGCLNWEKYIPQSIIVNLEININQQIEEDNIEKTVNIDHIFQIIESHCKTHCNLLEILTQNIHNDVKNITHNLINITITKEKYQYAFSIKEF